MKKTTRILSLILCLAMLVGVFASNAFAAEPTFIINEDFTDLVKNVETNATWHAPFVHVPVEEQEDEEETPAIVNTNFLVLTGTKNEANHEARFQYSFGDDLATSQLAWNTDVATDTFTTDDPPKAAFSSGTARYHHRGAIAGLEYKFDAKIDGANMGVTMYQSFYTINFNYTPANHTGRIGNVLITADGKIYGKLAVDEAAYLGQINTTKYDLTEWHTYTFRWVQNGAWDGKYLLWIYIDGEFVSYDADKTLASGNGGTKDYFAIKVHETEGTVMIDNISVTQANFNHAGTGDNTPANIAYRNDNGEPKVIMTEDFTTGTWGDGWHANTSTGATAEVVESLADDAESADSKHVKLNHAATAENQRVYIGAVLPTDASNFIYEYSKISTKDLTFEAKITDGATMRIEFYIIWDLYKYNGDTETSGRYVSVDIASDGTVTNATKSVAMGTVPASVDMSQWHTYTLRCSRSAGGSGVYDVQLLIDGVAIAYTGESTMNGQGTPQYDRFAIHARSNGSIEIDNIKVDELYLDARMGAVTTDSVNTIWTEKFNNPDAFTYTADGYVPGEWKTAANSGTEMTFVADEVAEEETPEEPAPALPGENGGYLLVNTTTSKDGYLVRLYDTGNTRLPDGVTHWMSADICVEGGGVSLEIGSVTDQGSGRKGFMMVRADGVFYRGKDGIIKVCDLPNTGWNNYMLKIDPVGAGKGTLYINGVQKAEFNLYIQPLTDTDNFYSVKFYTSKDWGLTGTAKVDNLKVTTGAAPVEVPAETADASIIGLAAMMLPVSGIGLGALALKRKKEN